MPASDSEAEDNPRLLNYPTNRTPTAAIAHATLAAGNGAHGIWTATPFQPPPHLAHASPPEIFAPRLSHIGTSLVYRFVLRRRHVPALGDLKTMAIYTDGACSDNGRSDPPPRGGCAFFFRPDVPGGTVGFALEARGADGAVHAHTSNRAELRAAIAALGFRAWGGEGWRRVVVVTDSEYVGVHATGWVRRWAERGWRTSGGREVKNRDFWEALSARIGVLARGGCEVGFWTVPRRWNGEADAAARAAVGEVEREDYGDICGVLV